MNGLLIIILLFGGAWLLLLVPARRRRAQHEAMQDSVEVGDEIITAGGLHGTVMEIDDQTEVEPGEDGEDEPAPGTDAEPR
jgi:preprotein translocase subunit YajC